jgi:hypothetical protein
MIERVMLPRVYSNIRFVGRFLKRKKITTLCECGESESGVVFEYSLNVGESSILSSSLF